MYAKLFSRIAQSSLMEEPIETRYTFMMLLAIADQSGDVIGTDVALARTINLPLATFTEAVKALMEPDPHSNSQDQEGRRLVPSDNGRGYRIVNYTAYRAIKTAEEKKTYMREYMRARREALKTKDVTPVNICKPALSDVTHAEAEEEAEEEADKDNTPQPDAQASEVLSLWNSRNELAKVRSFTQNRKRAIKARMNDPFFRQNWKEAFQRMLESPFLTGTNDKGWRADFDWFIKPDSVPRIMEGKYDRKAPVKTYSHANGYNESTSIDHL
jgi:hypothetical protein